MSITVLVADDATFVRDLIKRALRRLLPEAEILEAQDGVRAQALMRQRPVDLILSDWEMPQMSGEELLRWVRGEPAMAKIPFVMITSRGDRNHVVQAVNAGVNDYLTKPFTADELARKLFKQFKRLGVEPATRASNPQSSPYDTVGVLTGNALTGAAGAATRPRARAASSGVGATAQQGSFRGRAYLRFARGSVECQVRDITLQAITGIIAREPEPPALFESGVVDLELPNGETLARVNGYVHALQAVRADPNADQLKIILRFVDKDPAKLEALSRCLGARSGET